MIFAIIIVVAIVAVIALVLYKEKEKNKEDEIEKLKSEIKKTENTIIFEDEIEETLKYNKKPLLTKREEEFYKKIKPICDNSNIIILSKVRLADIVEPNKDLPFKEKQTYLNKIIKKHIDFILCKPDNMEIIALVELDDTTHRQKKRIESDEFKNKLCKEVGYRLIRVNSYEEFEREFTINY